MLHLRAHLRFRCREYSKMQKNKTKKMHFQLQLMIHLTVESRGAPKDVLNDLHKDPHESIGGST